MATARWRLVGRRRLGGVRGEEALVAALQRLVADAYAARATKLESFSALVRRYQSPPEARFVIAHRVIHETAYTTVATEFFVRFQKRVPSRVS
jgi:hypothetical protein